MRNILDQVKDWEAPFALATVVSTWSSAPQKAGTSMAVDTDGNVIGSLTGGCIEADVFQRCLDVIETGVPQEHTYGISNSEANDVGLTCGGSIDVLIQRISPSGDLLRTLHEQTSANEAIALCAVTDGVGSGHIVLVSDGELIGSTGDSLLDRQIIRSASHITDDKPVSLIDADCPWSESTPEARLSVFSFAPAPHMIIFGSSDHVAALCQASKLMGFRVTICDVKPTFTTPERFPDADEVVVDWPDDFLRTTATDKNTIICILTHDMRFDTNLLLEAIRTDARYVGAMGSLRLHRDRMRRLLERNATGEELNRLHSPIGLDIGGRGPSEVAVSILAEIISLQRRGTSMNVGSMKVPALPDVELAPHLPSTALSTGRD